MGLEEIQRNGPHTASAVAQALGVSSRAVREAGKRIKAGTNLAGKIWVYSYQEAQQIEAYLNRANKRGPRFRKDR